MPQTLSISPEIRLFLDDRRHLIQNTKVVIIDNLKMKSLIDETQNPTALFTLK